jgi:hypothetical protein
MPLSLASSPSRKLQNCHGLSYLFASSTNPYSHIYTGRGYIVPAKPLKTDAEKAALSKAVAAWVETKVARHKFLRGGVILIDAIPKR